MDASRLLSLPVEIRHQILIPLMTAEQPLRIRCLFIRTHYRNVFMTQQLKRISTNLLRICKQLTAECLPILYGGIPGLPQRSNTEHDKEFKSNYYSMALTKNSGTAPMFDCSCRIPELASQIGWMNFNLIRRMTISFDDLDTVVQCLKPCTPNSGCSGGSGISFFGLEELCTEGYQMSSLDDDRGSRTARSEGLALCEAAKQILESHPKLTTLLQRNGGDGGSDALDLTLGRVKWRFVRDTTEKFEEEVVLELASVTEQLRNRLQDPIQGASSLPVAWTESGGAFLQYPYLQSV